MRTEVYEIVVANELPRIGSGYRLVVAEFGVKWVYVRGLQGETGKHKLPVKTWNQIKKKKQMDPESVLQRLRAMDRVLGHKPRRKL